MWLRTPEGEQTERLNVGLGPKQAEDGCGWMGVGRTSGMEQDPGAWARNVGFPSKTSVSMIAQAVATGGGRSKG